MVLVSRPLIVGAGMFGGSRDFIRYSYPKKGINYGVGGQTNDQIDADLTYLRQYFDRLRVTYPAFNNPSSIAYWQKICERAVAKGFEVMWGVTCPQAESANFTAFCNKVFELAPWAAANDIILGVNEEAYHNNDAVISDTAVFTALCAMSRRIKAEYPRTRLCISLAGDGELAAFIAHDDRGGFDLIGLNQYDTLANFRSNIAALIAKYGRRGIVTEYNTGRGFDPAFGNENTWFNDIKARTDVLQRSQISTFYFYTYAYNAEGDGKWNMRTGTNPNTHRQAFNLFTE